MVTALEKYIHKKRIQSKMVTVIISGQWDYGVLLFNFTYTVSHKLFYNQHGMEHML